MIRRMYWALDARLVLSVAALIVVSAISWGFVQRGHVIASSERSVEALSAQLADVSADNRAMQRQMARAERDADRDERAARRDRAALMRELIRLNRWLRENGVLVPSERPAPSGGPRMYEPPAGGGGQGGGGGQPPNEPPPNEPPPNEPTPNEPPNEPGPLPDLPDLPDLPLLPDLGL